MALLLNLEHLHILPETCLRHAAAVSRGADRKAALNCDRGVVLACDFASDRARRNPAFRGVPYAIIPASSHYAMHLPEINPAETAHKILAKAMGLEDYCWIRDHLDQIGMGTFQRRFSYFFKLRRSAKWKVDYFAFMARARKRGTTFEEALRHLYALGGKVVMSFASKLVFVLDPGRPIWDSIVTKKFGLELKLPDGPAKLDEAVLAYGRFEVAYAELLSSKSGRAALAYFDRTFPEYAAKISAVKKLDCLLWSAGAETDDDEVW